MAETPKKTSRKGASRETKTGPKASAPRTKSTASAQKSAAAPKKVARPQPAAQAPREDVLHRMVAEAAYYRAEKQGFEGHPMDHWLAAEAEILQQIPAAK